MCPPPSKKRGGGERGGGLTTSAFPGLIRRRLWMAIVPFLVEELYSHKWYMKMSTYKFLKCCLLK